jgi:hypothetical protein
MRLVASGLLAALMFAAAPRGVDAQAAKEAKGPAVVGTWTGGVATDVGAMQMTVTIKSTDGKLAGEISTPHGAFVFTSIAEADGHWTLKFKTSDGATGQMKGVVKGDSFTGDWDFAPRATGTFELTKSKG